MPTGVIDVGSNTVRLQVSRAGRTVLSKREMLRLGADVEAYGRVSELKLEVTREVVAAFAADARAAGAADLAVLITSPGRQAANGPQLLAVLAEAADCPARILSAQEEGRLAFVGALSEAPAPARRSVAVVDVGGGSAQIVVGTRRDGPAWSHSIDLGSQRLASRTFRNDPPGAAAVGAARAEVHDLLAGVEPPAIRTAFAVGGSARALKRIVGARLDVAELDHLLELLAETPTDEVADRYGIGVERARTLAAGAAILAEIGALLQLPLKVLRGGVREGALLELAAEQRRAAA